MRRQKFFLIAFTQMFSLGSIRLKDFGKMAPGMWWYEFTFLFIEISWGYHPGVEQSDIDNLLRK